MQRVFPSSGVGFISECFTVSKVLRNLLFNGNKMPLSLSKINHTQELLAAHKYLRGNGLLHVSKKSLLYQVLTKFLLITGMEK